MENETETLNITLASAAESWKRDRELTQIVAGFREQAKRWSIEQAAGSRKRVTTKQIPVSSALSNLKITL